MDKDHSYYHVVYDEHRTGKTMLIIKVAREIRKGIIYVDTPVNIEEFDNSFGKALNLIFDEDAILTLQLKRKFFGDTKAFKHAAEVYKSKHSKPLVIVYDNINKMINENPKILDILQDDTKKNADSRKYVTMFVSNKIRSAWSHAKQLVIEIGDLSKEESMEYLTKKHKINEVEAKSLYELVGSYIVELQTVADDFVA
ncbi:4482_t:CDS:2 [Acaulospora morrowiae]|uniref:4482_t:CDS:1 n=1 Tax=Acaulospora morrowiae TaxID=94023 RepID=A0A9N9C1D8_9GLOM|nr:4482_t:CDS:2 [Acaulospora morrowiae]